MLTSPLTKPIIAVPRDLAATLGLEEAVLLQFLSEWASHRETETDGSSTSRRINMHALQRQLPFWGVLEIDRIARSLQDKGVISVSSPPLQQGGELHFCFQTSPSNPEQPEPVAGATRLPRHWSPGEDTLASLEHREGIPRSFAAGQVDAFVRRWYERAEPAYSWNEKFYRHAVAAWRRAQQPEPESTAISRDWRPSEDALVILENSGIEKSFIQDAIPEFILYWQEKDREAGAWDSKFVQHLRGQWRIWQEALEKGIEPGLMPSDWEPPAEIHDMLKKSHISPEFAEEKVPEFVLYWREAGQSSKSWGSVFMRFVKREWASRHNMAHTGDSQGKWQDFVGRHTDASWRHGA